MFLFVSSDHSQITCHRQCAQGNTLKCPSGGGGGSSPTMGPRRSYRTESGVSTCATHSSAPKVALFSLDHRLH